MGSWGGNLTFDRDVLPIPFMELDFGCGCFFDENVAVFGPEGRVSTQEDVSNDATDRLSINKLPLTIGKVLPNSPNINGFAVPLLQEDLGGNVAKAAGERVQLFVRGVQMLGARERSSPWSSQSKVDSYIPKSTM